MKRQKIQRELMKLEQENLEKREEIVIKKDETSTKTRSTAMHKVRSQGFRSPSTSCLFTWTNYTCTDAVSLMRTSAVVIVVFTLTLSLCIVLYSFCTLLWQK